MLGKIRSKKTKRGLSNIVGSLLMIVLTIVAALLLGHFAFGLFASNSHNAQISISDISIIVPGVNQQASVTVTVTDTGNDPVNVNSITVGGIKLTTTPTTPVTLHPGQSITFTGAIAANTLQIGTTVVVQALATDTVTNQQIATQASTVVQD